jgi:hypothetical protein
MGVRNSCAGRYFKPPYGVVAKSYGVERTRKRWNNPSGINNGDEYINH